MAVTSPALAQEATTGDAGGAPDRFSLERFLSPLLLAPSAVAIFIFVYGFIGYTFFVSLTNWQSAKPDMTIRQPSARSMPISSAKPGSRSIFAIRSSSPLHSCSWPCWVGSVSRSCSIGTSRAAASSAASFSFRTRCRSSPPVSPGAGSSIRRRGSICSSMPPGSTTSWPRYGVGPLKPGWITDPCVVWQLNGPIAAIFPPAGEWSLKLGVPVAMIPVAIAAAWQLSGFAMAMFLAGLGTISHEVREAAALDGASDWRLYKDIIIPLLNPITVSMLIILTHVSLKIFDLIFAMSGKGPGFATDVPGIFVYEMIFRAQRYNFGAAAAIVMLVGVSIVIVPYLARQLKSL